MISLAPANEGTIDLIKRQFKDTPRKANQILALLRSLPGRAVELEIIKSHPAIDPDMLPTPWRTEIWNHEESNDSSTLRGRPSGLLFW